MEKKKKIRGNDVVSLPLKIKTKNPTPLILSSISEKAIDKIVRDREGERKREREREREREGRRG